MSFTINAPKQLADDMSSIGEVNVGICCSCMPIIASLFPVWFEKCHFAWLYVKHRLTGHSIIKDSETFSSHGDLSVQSNGLRPPTDCHLATSVGSSQLSWEWSSPPDQITKLTHLRQDFELKSIDFDYHAHIERVSSKPSLNRASMGV